MRCKALKIERASNLVSRPTICPPSRRIGSLAFRSELMVSAPISDEETPIEDAAARSFKRPNYLDGSSRECSFARILFTNGGHPRHDKIYDPVCIVFQLCFFLNDRDESSFLEAGSPHPSKKGKPFLYPLFPVSLYKSLQTR